MKTVPHSFVWRDDSFPLLFFNTRIHWLVYTSKSDTSLRNPIFNQLRWTEAPWPWNHLHDPPVVNLLTHELSRSESVESVHCRRGHSERQTCSANGCPSGERTVVGSEATGPDSGWSYGGVWQRCKVQAHGLPQVFWSSCLQLMWAQRNWTYRDKYSMPQGIIRCWKTLARLDAGPTKFCVPLVQARPGSGLTLEWTCAYLLRDHLSCVLDRAAESTYFKRLRLRFCLKISSPTATPTPA